VLRGWRLGSNTIGLKDCGAAQGIDRRETATFSPGMCQAKGLAL